VFQYTGWKNDGNGLYYYRARYYKPQLARFISEDPLGFHGGNENLYTYVGDDPIADFLRFNNAFRRISEHFRSISVRALGLCPTPEVAVLRSQQIRDVP